MAAVKEQRNNERELWWGEAPEAMVGFREAC
jgi:hypothetical protein